MRTIIQIINQEYGKEGLAIFRKWENLNMKMCDFPNHRRFSLWCLGNGIILVSIRLKNNVRTQRSDSIIQKAERSLLNERIREVNITLDWLKHDTYMYQSKLSAIISQEHMVECQEFMKEHKELRHKSVMDRQKKKYLKLWHEKYQSGSSSIGTGGRSNQDKNKTNIGLLIYPVNPYLQLRRQSWHMAQILLSLLRPPFKNI